MVFHQARLRAGDAAFVGALRRFVEANRFRRASWADLAQAFSAETGEDWTPYFVAWTTREGMPELELEVSGGAVRARQVQLADPWPLHVPVWLTVAGEPEARRLVLEMEGARTAEQPVARDILRVDLDRRFDVLRRVHPSEVPSALSTLLGGAPDTFVLPAAAPGAELEAWRSLAEAWSGRAVLDTELAALPPRDVWVLGSANRFAAEVRGRVGLAAQGPVTLGDQAVGPASSLVLVAPGAGGAVGLIAGPPAEAVPGLARKLPHYPRWSWLVFEGPEPKNVGKGQWSPAPSEPVAVQISAGAPPPAVPPSAPLAP
jgi:hypothetical protein